MCVFLLDECLFLADSAHSEGAVLTAVGAGVKPGLFAAAREEKHKAAVPDREPLEGVLL